MPMIGYLSYTTAEYEAAALLPAFRQGLREIGYVEEQNVTIEYRWAEFQYERLAPMAADLVRHSVTVIAALGGTPPALVAKATMPHLGAGNVKGIKSAIHLSGAALDTYNAPPTLGEHTHEVLTELLGYTSEDVDALARGGVV